MSGGACCAPLLGFFLVAAVGGRSRTAACRLAQTAKRLLPQVARAGEADAAEVKGSRSGTRGGLSKWAEGSYGPWS